MKNALERGYCTRPNCRQFLAMGQGHQVQTPISMERYCEKHFKELMEAPDIVGGPSAHDALDRGGR